MDPVRALVLTVCILGCSSVPIRPVEAQLVVACEGVTSEVARRVGPEASPFVQEACVNSLRRVFGTEPELITEFPDAGR